MLLIPRESNTYLSFDAPCSTNGNMDTPNDVHTPEFLNTIVVSELPNEYSQLEGINYTKTYAYVSCLEAIHILLSFAAHTKMKLYQMDVKNAFLNGLIQEEVYVEQPPEFESNTFHQHVFKLNKSLYGLKQAP